MYIDNYARTLKSTALVLYSIHVVMLKFLMFISQRFMENARMLDVVLPVGKLCHGLYEKKREKNEGCTKC